MASNNKRERHWVYLDSANDGEYGWKYIDQYMKIHRCNSRGEAIEGIIHEHQEMQNELLGNKVLVQQIVAEIKKSLDPIRLRTGSTERSVAMFRELLNGFIVLHGMEEQFPVMDVQSDAIVRAEEKIADQIKAQQVYRNSVDTHFIPTRFQAKAANNSRHGQPARRNYLPLFICTLIQQLRIQKEEPLPYTV